jgi:hypothetical protein
LIASLPGAGFFRFPSKALLLPFAVLSMLARVGMDRLAAGRRWRVLAAVAALPCIAGLAFALSSGPLASAIVGDSVPTVPLATVASSLALDGWRLAALSGAAIVLSVATLRQRVRSPMAAGVVAALMVADLVSAARGVNPQAPAGFYQPLPEVEALGLGDLGGGRVFVPGLDQSPAFRRFLAAGGPGRALWSFFVSRQALAPYANVLDRVEIAEGKDLTGFIPRAPVVTGEDLDPARIGAVLPRLREAAVSRVVSLDPLDHADLRVIAEVPAGPPGLTIHVYAVRDPWPRAFVACGAGCAGTVRRHASGGETVLGVQAPAAGLVVVRDNFARGWHATVDGGPTEIRRAGDYMAVPVGPGAREIVMRYRPPELRRALVLTLFGLAASAIVLVRARV